MACSTALASWSSPDVVAYLVSIPNAGRLLNILTQRGKADVVISSTWRLGHTLTELKKILFGIGYTGRTLGTTPDLNRIHVETWIPRGVEIEMWMREHEKLFKVESFVILDDDSDMEPHHNRHVKTNHCVGLTELNVEQALTILSIPV